MSDIAPDDQEEQVPNPDVHVLLKPCRLKLNLPSHFSHFENLKYNKDQIRNVTVLAHVGHGKSTFTTSIVGRLGTTDAEVASRGGISLWYCPEDVDMGSPMSFLINLIDSERPLYYPDLVVSDGAILLMDSVEGPSDEMESLLTQALRQRVRVVFTLNKVDEFFFGEHKLDGEDAYQLFRRHIASWNYVKDQYEDPHLYDVQVSPELGNIAFSSGLGGWAFTLKTFAKVYCKAMKVSVPVMMKLLWGENFFDRATGEWTTYRTDSPTCKRGFVFFCYDPIRRVIEACLDNQKEKLRVLLTKRDVKVTDNMMQLSGEDLINKAMKDWLPAWDALFDMVSVHLPSPATAQAYRVQNLYSGPSNSKHAKSIRDCDPAGPLILYVSKMLSPPGNDSKLAFGRVFSGGVFTGSAVSILGPNHDPRKLEDATTGIVGQIEIWDGKEEIIVDNVPCGNLVIISGLDQYINETATLTNVDGAKAKKYIVKAGPSAGPPTKDKHYKALVKKLRDLQKEERETWTNLHHIQDEKSRVILELKEAYGGVPEDDVPEELQPSDKEIDEILEYVALIPTLLPDYQRTPTATEKHYLGQSSPLPLNQMAPAEQVNRRYNFRHRN